MMPAEEVLRLPDDPGRWGPVRAHLRWERDPENLNDPHSAWDDPDLIRRRIGTPEELASVAHACVVGARLVCRDPNGIEREIVGDLEGPFSKGITEDVIIENLQTLIEAVRGHRQALVARVETDQHADGRPRVVRRWVEDAQGREQAPGVNVTKLALGRCVVEYCDCSHYEIACTLWAKACFASEARFDEARFAANACFEQACFSESAGFSWALFCGQAQFSEASFARGAWFNNAYFASMAAFDGARFGGAASFDQVRFNGQAGFSRANFAVGAQFDRVHFASRALFEGTRVLGITWFFKVRFSGWAAFTRAHFAGWAFFDGACFNDLASFDYTEFEQVVAFNTCPDNMASRVPVRILRTGRVVFQRARFRGIASFEGAIIHGGLFFTESTLDERLTFVGMRVRPGARLGMNNFLARGGATIELKRGQLEVERARRERAAEVRERARTLRMGPRRSWGRHLLEACRPLRLWLGVCRAARFMEGDDSRDPRALERAAHDYDLLAANYRNQPATDWEEDWCRWRGHELRRLIRWMKWREDATAFFASSRTAGAQGGRLPFQARWVFEYVLTIGAILWGYAGLIARAVWYIIWEWLVRRTMVGYILQTHRIIVSGAAIMVVWALLYKALIGPGDIAHGAYPCEAEAYAYWDSQWLNPFYLSMTTFVTLGYGDFAPSAGWLKFMTSLEGLLGVTLLALFTVAWGRKMVR